MDRPVSRTEELRQLSRRGKVTSLNNSDAAPFVVWPKGDELTFVEGELMSIWTGKYGPVARLEVRRASDGAAGAVGSGDVQSRVAIEPGTELNVGLNYARLEGIQEDQVGQIVHIAFTGWGETKNGDRFRRFDVYILPRVDDVTGADVESGSPWNARAPGS